MGIRQGRTIPSTVFTALNLTTGSAYPTGAAVGSAFEIPYAVGAEGALIVQVNWFDQGSANAALRQHFYSRAPSAIPNGSAFQLAPADFGAYLGSVTGTTSWNSAGASLRYQMIVEPNIGIYTSGGARSVYSVFEALGQYTWGNTANPLVGTLVGLQD